MIETMPNKKKSFFQSNKQIKYISLAVFPALALILMGAGTASARGMFGIGGASNQTPEQTAVSQQSRFQAQANLLGISVDEVKNAWASGKTLQELATEKGVTKEQLQQKKQDLQKQHISEQLKVLVEKGVITQAQADQKLASIVKFQATKKNGKGHGYGHGIMRIK